MAHSLRTRASWRAIEPGEVLHERHSPPRVLPGMFVTLSGLVSDASNLRLIAPSSAGEFFFRQPRGVAIVAASLCVFLDDPRFHAG
jgi:hypothetical protein